MSERSGPPREDGSGPLSGGASGARGERGTGPRLAAGGHDEGPASLPLRLSPESARAIRDEVSRAGGREVSFLADVTRTRAIVHPRAVARGNHHAVLAAARDAREGSVMIHNHPSGVLEPSDADLAVAARVYDDGIGTAIVSNEADRMYVVVEPPEPRTVEELDPRELADLLGPRGPLASMPGYEDRRGQRRMLRFVADRFNQGGVGLVEAGTGTGKSLAYLLPAARWALRNGERAIVSTNTINLQQQLFAKDLELVADILGEPLRWTLAKGRGHYVSIRRARLAADSADSLFPDDRSAELRALAEWAETTDDGSRADLASTPSPEAWDEVRSESDACLRAKCPFFQQCHYQRARREWAAADVVVVNHALFFADLAIRIATDNFADAAVLPPYKRVVFDEAHHIEDAATPHLGAQATRVGIARTLSRLDRRGKGVLGAVLATLKSHSASIPARRLSERVRTRTRARTAELREGLSAFFDLLEPWVRARAQGGALRLGREPPGGAAATAEAGPGAPALLLRQGPPAPAAHDEPAQDRGVDEALERVLILLDELQMELEVLSEDIGDDPELRADLQGRLLDLQSCGNRLHRAERALRECLRPRSGGRRTVRWLELRRGPRTESENLTLSSAPVDIGPVLSEHLFGNVETSVLTSATMAVAGDLGYMRRRLGIRDDAPKSVLGSPFDHSRQSCLVVPSGLPPHGSEAHAEATARIVVDVAGVTDGGIFALFTSFAALRSVAATLRRQGAGARWPLFVQGEAHRARLLADFVRSGRGILLGTSSFWEGVDVPGRPLRALVIQKLPFRVPTEPVTEARLEAMSARGENSFYGLMVPDAALRLKQGMGRLIRTRADRGAILLLDGRILTRRYGRILQNALPPMPLIRGPWDVARRSVAEFYRTH